MSVSFRLEGFDDFELALKGFASKAEQGISKWVRNYASSLAYTLVMETPQYSGAAASAWRVGIGAPVYVTVKPDYYVPGAVEDQIKVDDPYSKRKRNMTAVNDALTACTAVIGTYSLPMGSLYISNGLPYTGWFETGEYAPGDPLRIQNLPQRKVVDSMRAALVTMIGIGA